MNHSSRTLVPWLSAAQAAEYLGFPSRRAFSEWMRRQKAKTGRQPVKVHWLGDRMRFRQVDLDRCVESEPVQKKKGGA